ncbi:MAG TPA: hypothetical protein VN755_11910, partial [Steroidobacteraceae bacterium]|nr:hypothetical protein [Steroidobacteraceae bacterium]
AKYVNSKPVWFPNYDTRFDNDNRGGSAYRTLAIHDLDGTTTGVPNSYVLLHDGAFDTVATDDTCKIQPTWNASVCAGDVGRMSFAAQRPGSAAPGGLRAPGAPGAPGAGAAPGAAPPGLAGAAPRVGAFGGGGAPPQPPVVLSRKGKEFHLTGNQSTVRAGTEINVKTERPEVTVSLSEMNKDSWVMFELPGFTKASSGTKQESLDALRKANETSYFKDENALWVKLMVPADPEPPVRPTLMQTSISVSR